MPSLAAGGVEDVGDYVPDCKGNVAAEVAVLVAAVVQ